MVGIKSFFESFKEFIWDVIGFILPGVYCLILTSISVSNNYWLNLDSVFDSKYYTYIIVIISYLLGYAIYGLNLLVYKHLLKNRSYIKKIEDKVKNRISYQTTLQILKNRYNKKGICFDSNNATVRDLRSIAMGLFPEQDHKIYTFTFRADIANHAGSISLLFGTLGLLSWVINYITPFDVVNVDYIHKVLYIVLIIFYFLFASMRNHFYAISIGLPFSLLSTNEIYEK